MDPTDLVGVRRAARTGVSLAASQGPILRVLLFVQGPQIIEGVGHLSHDHGPRHCGLGGRGGLKVMRSSKSSCVCKRTLAALAECAIAVSHRLHVVWAMSHSVRSVIAPSSGFASAPTWSAGSIALPTSCKQGRRGGIPRRKAARHGPARRPGGCDKARRPRDATWDSASRLPVAARACGRSRSGRCDPQARRGRRRGRSRGLRP